jgi:hypothetical protein
VTTIPNVSEKDATHRISEGTAPRERYRCGACGNLTRFDIFESRRSRLFHHYSLGGELEIEEEEVLARDVEKVVCRWCGATDAIESISTDDV